MPHVLWPLLALLGLALALALHFAAWGRIYRFRADSDAVLAATCADGWQLAVAHFIPKQPNGHPPIILCHGLLANRLNMSLPGRYSVAGYLREHGYTCFAVDLRGCGESNRPPPGKRANDWSFTDHVRLDAPAVLELVQRTTGQPRASWVGHSMGGLIGLALAQGEQAERIATVVAMGSPTHWKHHRPLLAKLLAAGEQLAWSGRLHNKHGIRVVSPYLGRLPLPLPSLAINFDNIEWPVLRHVLFHVMADASRKTLAEFRSWFTLDAWVLGGAPAVDLRAGLAAIRCPVLLIGGTMDVLAPPRGLEESLQALGAPDKALVLFGKARGDKQDYGHGDLVFGRHAPEEIFPELERWLSAHG